MPVILRSSKQLGSIDKKMTWYGVTGTVGTLENKYLFSDIGRQIETYFTNIREEWWDFGKILSRTKHGNFAHTPTAASYNVDFGLMLAWCKLTQDVASKEELVLVVCDDPWVYRQLGQISGVNSLRPPALWKKRAIYFFRGYFSRVKLVLKFLTALIIFRTSKSAFGHGKISIIAYAHPDSKRDGFDAYFGSLIKELGGINRFLHTDGSLKLAKSLSNDITTSLHAWGSVWYLIPLLFRRWKINKENIKEEYRWLAERSVCIENGGGAIASNAWQSHCQERWARATKPKIILWPWENHPWERELVRVAKTLSVKTLGYQHAVIGPQQFNPGPRSNPDGFNSIPEKIICSGPAYYSQLLDWGMPADMLVIGGSFRYPPFNQNYYDSGGPIFVATSSDTQITQELMAAVEKAASKGYQFLIKIHPLYPKKIMQSKNITITQIGLRDQKGVSALLYATGASGLEGLLAGLPTLRLRPADKVAINVLPEGIEPIIFSKENLAQTLSEAEKQDALDWKTIYSHVDIEMWRKLLAIS